MAEKTASRIREILGRLGALHLLLQSDEHHTVSSLATALGVSERAIRYELEFMKDYCGAPIWWNRKQGHHYDEEWDLTIPVPNGYWQFVPKE